MSSPEQQVTPKVHLLPCNIAFNGPASISNYFQVEVSPDGSQYTSHFRGRKLVGKKIDFTESKAAMATAVTHPYMEDSASKTLEIQHSVDSFVLWGHDHPSSVNFTEMYDDLLEISTGVRLHFSGGPITSEYFTFKLCIAPRYQLSRLDGILEAVYR